MELSPAAIAALPAPAIDVSAGPAARRPIRRIWWVAAGAAIVLAAGAAYVFQARQTKPPNSATDLLAALSQAAPMTPPALIVSATQHYAAAPAHRAVAVDPLTGKHRWTGGWPTRALAEQRAAEECQLSSGNPCAILASDNDILPADQKGQRPLRASPALSYSGPFDAQRIPIVRASTIARPDVAGYAAATGAKAVALHPKGELSVSTGAASQHAAEQAALDACNAQKDADDKAGSCYLYASGNQVVLPLRKLHPITP